MTRIFSLSALYALPIALAAFAAPAQAASPEYCTFTSPASITCPGDQAVATRVARSPRTVQTAATDHCIATSPASIACPVAPDNSAVASVSAPVSISRN